jgi:hypothetical protein
VALGLRPTQERLASILMSWKEIRSGISRGAPNATRVGGYSLLNKTCVNKPKIIDPKLTLH